MAPLKTEIEALSAQRPASFSVVHAIWGVPIDLNSTAAPLAREDFQRLLVSLVTSPAIGHPIHWVPVMNTLMAFGDNERVQRLAGMADLLATSARPISSDQVYQFCTYLAREQLPGFIPWFGYQVLDQFSQKLPLSSAGVNEILEEYLTKKAEELLKAQDKGYYLPNNRIFKIKTTNIDPRVWFGSLLTSHEQMPELLLEVLWARIQLLHASCTDRPFEVGMMGREEAQLPHNFTLALAQRITNAKILYTAPILALLFSSSIERLSTRYAK